MLAVASLGALFSFLLAIRLARGTAGAPAFAAVLFLIASPLFYTQSMMVQLDMPAMTLTVAGAAVVPGRPLGMVRGRVHASGADQGDGHHYALGLRRMALVSRQEASRGTVFPRAGCGAGRPG